MSYLNPWRSPSNDMCVPSRFWFASHDANRHIYLPTRALPARAIAFFPMREARHTRSNKWPIALGVSKRSRCKARRQHRPLGPRVASFHRLIATATTRRGSVRSPIKLWPPRRAALSPYRRSQPCYGLVSDAAQTPRSVCVCRLGYC